MRQIDDPHRLLDINLDTPLSKDECLPVSTHRQSTADVISPPGSKPSEKVDDDVKDDKHKKHKNV